METVNNPFVACKDIFFKPNRVFATLAEKNNWSWVAFFAVLILAILPSYLYFQTIDFQWYKEMIIETNFANVSPAEQSMVRDNMTLEQTLSLTFIGGVIGLIIVNAILAVYLNAATKTDEENLNGFTDWYGFTWWVSLPVLIGSVISMAIILISGDPQLSQVDLSPTSLSFILGIGMGSDWFALTQNIRLESFWSMYLIAVGVSQWTRIPANKSYMIAAVPYLAVWGIWTLIIVF